MLAGKCAEHFQTITLRSGFETVKNRGERYACPCFTFLYIADVNEKKYGIICSRKFDMRAVRRNRARRLLREALRLFPQEILKPAMFLLIPRRAILNMKLQDVQKYLENAFRKSGLIE